MPLMLGGHQRLRALLLAFARATIAKCAAWRARRGRALFVALRFRGMLVNLAKDLAAKGEIIISKTRDEELVY